MCYRACCLSYVKEVQREPGDWGTGGRFMSLCLGTLCPNLQLLDFTTGMLVKELISLLVAPNN
jgi:hypothetical protein